MNDEEENWNFAEALWVFFEHVCTLVGLISFMIVTAFLIGYNQ